MVGSTAYVGSFDGYEYAINTATGAVLWKLNRGTPYVASPLLYDGLLYFFQHVTPILTCVDAATGKPHYEQQRLQGFIFWRVAPVDTGKGDL